MYTKSSFQLFIKTNKLPLISINYKLSKRLDSGCHRHWGIKWQRRGGCKDRKGLGCLKEGPRLAFLSDSETPSVAKREGRASPEPSTLQPEKTTPDWRMDLLGGLKSSPWPLLHSPEGGRPGPQCRGVLVGAGKAAGCWLALGI